MKLAPHTTGVFGAAGKSPVKQADPDYSLSTPQNRFFFTTSNGLPALSYGKAGTGENAITLGDKPLTFQITGVTGSLQSQDAAPDFQAWFDPTFRTTAPILKVTITYDQFGDGKNVITQQFDNFTMGSLPGYVQHRSQQAGGSVGTSFVRPATFASGVSTITVPNTAQLAVGMTVVGPGIPDKDPSGKPVTVTVTGINGNQVTLSAPTTAVGAQVPLQFGNYARLFTNLVNGSVTVTIVPVANVSDTAPVRFRTDAAAQQGRVSFLDLPYDFTTVCGKPVTQLSLGGQTFGPPLPDVAGTPPVKIEAVGSSPDGFTAVLNGSTATITATSRADQTLLVTADRTTGLLINNRFAAGDAGYASPFDFDSTQPGDQTLAASAASTVIIVGGNGDAVVPAPRVRPPPPCWPGSR